MRARFFGPMGSSPHPGATGVDRPLAGVSGARMSYAQNSDSSPDSLSPREQAILEFYAEGFGDSEIAARLGIGRRAISTLRAGAATKLAGRIASAHPFQIREVVLARSLDFEEI